MTDRNYWSAEKMRAHWDWLESRWAADHPYGSDFWSDPYGPDDTYPEASPIAPTMPPTTKPKTLPDTSNPGVISPLGPVWVYDDPPDLETDQKASLVIAQVDPERGRQAVLRADQGPMGLEWYLEGVFEFWDQAIGYARALRKQAQDPSSYFYGRQSTFHIFCKHEGA